MGEGFDDATPDPGELQPAPDRLWRHPAELGAEQAAANLAARRAAGRRWPAMVVSFIGGASVVGLAWLLSSNDGVIEQRTTNIVPPASQVIIDGPISFDQWAADIAEDNLTSVVGLHLGGDAPYKHAQAILYDDNGTLMASAHSLLDADPITAVLADGRALAVQVLAADTTSGVAVL
mgnify:FL=1